MWTRASAIIIVKWMTVTQGELDNAMKGHWPCSRSQRPLLCVGRNNRGAARVVKWRCGGWFLCFGLNRSHDGVVGPSCGLGAHGPAGGDVLWVIQGECNQSPSSVCTPKSWCIICCSTWKALIRCTQLHNQTPACSSWVNLGHCMVG